MKAKYQQETCYALIYHQAICEDNIFVTVKSYGGAGVHVEPKVATKVCLTNAEARRMFHNACNEFEKEHYECVYKDDSL